MAQLQIPGLATLTACLLACSSPQDSAPSVDGPPSDLVASSRRLYAQYETALQAGDRGRLSWFYHPEGAILVLNGSRMVKTRPALDSLYQGSSWTAPNYFSFDGLVFDSLSPSQVMVTGSFQWQSAGVSDTVVGIYAALVEAVDSSMAIRFEHETVLPGSGN